MSRDNAKKMTQLPANPSVIQFRSNTKEYFNRADRQPVTVKRNSKMYILISYPQYVQIVNQQRGAHAIHTVVTITHPTANNVQAK